MAGQPCPGDSLARADQGEGSRHKRPSCSEEGFLAGVLKGHQSLWLFMSTRAGRSQPCVPRRAPQAEHWGLWLSWTQAHGACVTAPTAGSRGTRPLSRGGVLGPPSLGPTGEASPLERQPLQGAPLPPGLTVGLAGSRPPGLRGASTPRGVPPPWSSGHPSSGRWGFSGAPGWGQGWTFLPCLSPAPPRGALWPCQVKLTLY